MNWRYNEQKEEWVNLDHFSYIKINDYKDMHEVVAYYPDGEKKQLAYTPVKANSRTWLREFLDSSNGLD